MTPPNAAHDIKNLGRYSLSAPASHRGPRWAFDRGRCDLFRSASVRGVTARHSASVLRLSFCLQIGW